MAQDLNIGIIGCDTSHVIAFTKLINDPSEKNYVPGGKVVANYPSYSDDMPLSRDRVDGFRKQVTDELGLTLCDSIEQMIDQVDVVMLLSGDGRRHLAELKPVVEAGKTVYVDKPFAVSLADAKEMVRMLNGANLPCFSSSALRFDPNLQAVLADPDRGQILACDTFGPATLDPCNPGLFWYGIHAVEMLFALMGTGCQSVRCVTTDSYDVAIGKWGDRIGTIRGQRAGKTDFGANVFCENTVAQFTYDKSITIYAPLVERILHMFQTGQTAVPLTETLEMVAFMTAALESTRNGGAEVALDSDL